MKFRKINLENKAVQARVAQINGGLAILKAVGFEPEDDGKSLYMEQVNLAVINNAIE